MAFIWIVLDYCLFVIFGKVHFTIVIMPNFFGLTRTNFISVIFFFGNMVEYSLSESCLQTVLSVGSDRGQRKL
jgi:hypothetical protein